MRERLREDWTSVHEAMTSVAARETGKANDVTVNDNDVVEARLAA